VAVAVAVAAVCMITTDGLGHSWRQRRAARRCYKSIAASADYIRAKG